MQKCNRKLSQVPLHSNFSPWDCATEYFEHERSFEELVHILNLLLIYILRNYLFQFIGIVPYSSQSLVSIVARFDPKRRINQISTTLLSKYSISQTSWLSYTRKQFVVEYRGKKVFWMIALPTKLLFLAVDSCDVNFTIVVEATSTLATLYLKIACTSRILL